LGLFLFLGGLAARYKRLFWPALTESPFVERKPARRADHLRWGICLLPLFFLGLFRLFFSRSISFLRLRRGKGGFLFGRHYYLAQLLSESLLEEPKSDLRALRAPEGFRKLQARAPKPSALQQSEVTAWS